MINDRISAAVTDRRGLRHMKQTHTQDGKHTKKLTRKQLSLYSTILHKIYTKHAISRIDIANETGITTATVSLICSELLSMGLIQEVGEIASPCDKAGRKKILLSVRPGHSYYIGAELSEKFFAFVLTDNTGVVLEKKTVTPDVHSTITTDFFAEQLLCFLKTALPLVPRINAVGIAVPGHFSPGSSRIMTNNAYWESFDLEALASKLPLPVFFSNNVHCMARAESLFFSEGDDTDGNFTFFHIGRGIHCAHMYHNDLYSKHNLNIGELGHITIQPGGELCECGKKGCLQTFASETWLVRKARLLYRTSSHTFLHQLAENEESISLSTILDAYNLGDTAIVFLIHQAVESIWITITNLNMIIDSSRVFVHSKLFCTHSTAALLREYLERKSSPFVSPPQQLIIKPYSPYTGAIGASAFAVWRALLQKD